MRGASALLYSIPRRGRLSQEAPTLPSLSTGCSGQDLRSEPSSSTQVMDTKRLVESDKAFARPNALNPPLLLLEGDELFLSSNGIARTYYELATSDKKDSAKMRCEPLGLEEFYDLKSAKKTFILRSSAPVEQGSITQGKRPGGVKLMGTRLAQLTIQEIDQGVLGAAGTGATTWEASIAMSLFWSSHADLLHGDTIELGSGIGLGGILSGLIGGTSVDSRITSMTLTDHNREVLDQCRENVRNSESAGQRHLKEPYRVTHLDWYDFLTDSGNSHEHREQYETVIASDCAYIYQDLVALARTMKALLKPNRSSRVHFFGPYNRGALNDLMQLLRNERMDLLTEYIDMKRYRLHPQSDSKNIHSNSCVLNSDNTDSGAIASHSTSTFLHVSAGLALDSFELTPTQNHLAEID